MTINSVPDEKAVDVTYTAAVKVALVAQPPVAYPGEARDSWFVYRIQEGIHLKRMSLVASWRAGMSPDAPGIHLHPQEGGLYHVINIQGLVTVEKGTAPDVVRQQAAELVRQALFEVPEVHVLGKWFIQAPVEVRLMGGRDRTPHAARFVLDEDPDDPATVTIFGFTFGDDWNGWAIPLLEREEAKRALATLFNYKAEGTDKPYAIYREKEGTFGVWDQDMEDYNVIEPEPIELPDEDETRLVYNFGQGFVWCEIPLRPGDWAYKYDMSDEELGVSFAQADRYNAFQRKALAETFPEGDPGAETVEMYLKNGDRYKKWLRTQIVKEENP